MSAKNSSNKPRLLILSDLWGFRACPWIDSYEDALKGFFDLTKYDCRELGGVDLESSSQELIHSEFVRGGIEKAVQKLVDLERDEAHILAFSVGGTIAWKAVAAGLKALSFTAVSATRLRHETQPIAVETALYFGELDAFRPEDEWASSLGVGLSVLEGEGHQVYTVSSVIQHIALETIDRSRAIETQF